MPPRSPGSQPGSQPPPSSGPQAPRGITMLGAQQTGKTTFIAALQIALLRKPELGWSLTGDNPASTRALVNFMTDMTDNHIFPSPTGAIENYRWSLEAELPKAVREWHWWGFRRRDLYVRVPLELVDAPGETADGSRLFGRAISERFVENLAKSAGIVLFYDPVSEFDRGDAFRHTYGVLAQLRSQAQHRGRLPHYVAVCVTKFDEIRVLESAQKLRLIEYDLEQEFPRVPEDDATEFFQRLIRQSRSDNAGLILPMLYQTFRSERIRFFVTSAIGFYLDPAVGVFDPDDYQNHIPGLPPEKDRIRGAIYPINVIEPVLWLGRHVARAAG